MRAIVVGAGIGGLSAALALQRRGIVVDVGIRTGTLVMTTRRGQTVMRDRRGLAAGLPFPQFSIHRGHLQRVLVDALRDAGTIVRVDHRLVRFERHDGVVRAHVRRRSGASRCVFEGDVLIGADGIRSTVRAQLVPAEGQPLWNGSMMWRGATEWPTFLDGRTMIVAGGNDGKLVIYPIGRGRTSRTRLTNWGVVGTVAPPGRPPPDPVRHRDVWTQPGRRSDLAPHIARFTSDVVDVEGLVAATSPILEYPMCDREPLARWSQGRVTLLGDAAHPMYPMGSNGATQAIIDAANLVTHLASTDVEPALRAYERDRLHVCNELVRLNRLGGPERIIDLVEQLAPDGFGEIGDVIAADELRRIVADYAAAGTPTAPRPGVDVPSSPAN